jgi:hypothetical protein
MWPRRFIAIHIWLFIVSQYMIMDYSLVIFSTLIFATMSSSINTPPHIPSSAEGTSVELQKLLAIIDLDTLAEYRHTV